MSKPHLSLSLLKLDSLFFGTFQPLTLRSTAGILNNACCCSSCNIFISDDEFELGWLTVGLLLIWLLFVKFELFINELEVWSIVLGLRWFWLWEYSVCGRFVNTGEFGAEFEWCPPSCDCEWLPYWCDEFGGVRSRSFDLKSLYAVFTPRLPCLTLWWWFKYKEKMLL